MDPATDELRCTGQHELTVEFNPIKITGMLLQVFDTNAGSNDLVLTEMMVHSACVRTRSFDTSILVANIYQARSQCVEQVSLHS